MCALVDVETRFLGETLEAKVALVRSFPRVRTVVNLQILLAGERGRASGTLERPTLNYPPQYNRELEQESPRPHTLHIFLVFFFTLGACTYLSASSRAPLGWISA